MIGDLEEGAQYHTFLKIVLSTPFDLLKWCRYCDKIEFNIFFSLECVLHTSICIKMSKCTCRVFLNWFLC